MEPKINRAKLVQLIAGSYTVAELEGFLEDHFRLRLDHIIEARGVGLIEVVRNVVNYFDRRGNLVDLVQELSKHKPDKVNIGDLLIPLPPIPRNSSSAPTSTSSPMSSPLATPHFVKPASNIFIGQSDKDMPSRKKLSNRQRFPHARIIIAIWGCILLVGSAVIWILNALGTIKGEWSTILTIVFASLGVIFAFLQWIIPFPPVGNTAK